jgi:hypothetical protein
MMEYAKKAGFILLVIAIASRVAPVNAIVFNKTAP